MLRVYALWLSSFPPFVEAENLLQCSKQPGTGP